MKLIIAVLVLVACAVSGDVKVGPLELTAFDYHRRFGIPEAKRIMEGESQLVADPSRIVGGSVSTLGQHPHQGGLVISVLTKTSVCGCSLLSNTKAVTAAHCWFDGVSQAGLFEVVLGSLTLFKGGTRIKTKNVVMHNQWDPLFMFNDIAMITFTWVTYTTAIQPIALPTGSDLNNTFANTSSVASGWGRNSDSQSGVPINTVLRHVNLLIITNAVCKETFGSYVLASNVCTSGAGGVGICRGDSGGPLTVVSNNVRILVGITSFILKAGCELGFPSVFTRVTSFINWIYQNM